MRYALIMAGGSGTRLWPMSREELPKQLLSFIGGKNLVQISAHRLEGLVPATHRYVCAARTQEALIRKALPELGAGQFLGEPCGRDTLNAVGLGAAVLERHDPEAVIAVFTADHIIEPVAEFIRIVDTGFRLTEAHDNVLVTFGIAPTHAATGYGYLQVGAPFGQGARRVEEFREKPSANVANGYFAAGAERYLWNSGMFVWRARTLLDCIRRYHPDNYRGLTAIAEAWDTPRQNEVVEALYPTLPRISVDFAVMEPASRDAAVRVVAVPMPLRWLDVGSWPSFAETCPKDADGNSLGGGKALLQGCRDTLVASSDPRHLIAAIGTRDLIVIHTPEATLVCPADQAEGVKAMQKRVAETLGHPYV